MSLEAPEEAPIALLPLILTGCVLSISGTTTIDAPVDRVVVDVSKGDVRIVGQPGPIGLTVDYGGMASDDVGHHVRDGVLFVDYHCGGPELCGGEVELTVPPRTPVEVALGGGDLEVSGLRTELIALVGAGAADLSFEHAPDLVEVVVAAGEIELALPPGSYALHLDGTRAVVVDPAIVDDPDSPHVVRAEAGAGRIELLPAL